MSPLFLPNQNKEFHHRKRVLEVQEYTLKKYKQFAPKNQKKCLTLPPKRAHYAPSKTEQINN